MKYLNSKGQYNKIGEISLLNSTYYVGFTCEENKEKMTKSFKCKWHNGWKCKKVPS